ncbi:BPSS1780 family membrane protein [Xenorhabdus sp. PR6a]|uniref:BPSS1780 family membrane protein n=1 Tax=Xenorhabdus sp. PR6a TaxID=3025877 RepID=UPI002358399B|nr:BPSS1780 family membrane protein [Xenorhabdus sp. PR6a]MDC9580255.1 BPSS1780 family membrane protein [Xenorhabdus sp. PR6a]
MDNKNLSPDSEKSHNNSVNENTIFIPNGQAIGASAAIAWIGDAWHFISPKLGMWILMGIIYGVISLGILFIPKFGFLLPDLLEPLFFAGIIAICETQRTTGKFKLGKLLFGFRYKFGTLLTVGLIVCGIKILGNVVSALLDGNNIYQVVFEDLYSYFNYDLIAIHDNSETSFLSFCALLISLFFSTAYSWFSPALIILKDFNVGKALSMSLNAFWKNFLGVILFIIFLYLLFVISMIPLFLGVLFITPLTLVTSYSSYRRVFYKQESQKDEIAIKN